MGVDRVVYLGPYLQLPVPYVTKHGANKRRCKIPSHPVAQHFQFCPKCGGELLEEPQPSTFKQAVSWPDAHDLVGERLCSANANNGPFFPPGRKLEVGEPYASYQAWHRSNAFEAFIPNRRSAQVYYPELGVEGYGLDLMELEYGAALSLTEGGTAAAVVAAFIQDFESDLTALWDFYKVPSMVEHSKPAFRSGIHFGVIRYDA